MFIACILGDTVGAEYEFVPGPSCGVVAEPGCTQQAPLVLPLLPLQPTRQQTCS